MTYSKRLLRIFQIGIFFLLGAIPLRSGSIGSGTTTCPASGSKAVASASTFAGWVIVQAPVGNAGVIYVGATGVTSTTGPAILAGGSFMAPPRSSTSSYNLNQRFIACSNSNDTIVYIYAQ